MPAAGRVGVDKFSTGIIMGPGAATVFIDGAPASLVGDAIAPHGMSPHDKSKVMTASVTVLAEGKGVVQKGLALAICGHTATTGSFTTDVGP
jgi:uncharacterized Zn-binding protein involved in type VI secretion